jgi:hypothetical protein
MVRRAAAIILPHPEAVAAIDAAWNFWQRRRLEFAAHVLRAAVVPATLIVLATKPIALDLRNVAVGY